MGTPISLQFKEQKCEILRNGDCGLSVQHGPSIVTGKYERCLTGPELLAMVGFVNKINPLSAWEERTEKGSANASRGKRLQQAFILGACLPGDAIRGRRRA
ncbi:hypothetical protein [Cohaesibacter intestini]|uniref:hypothetical protein n=1 Tax=Cohaesibacter intestini TaxID=2211145 RepID=UPI00130080A5|nr:hypothetical protein [Cohaesibacter intestini]